MQKSKMKPPPLFDYLEFLFSSYFGELGTRKALPNGFNEATFAAEHGFNELASKRFLNALAYYGILRKQESLFSVNSSYKRSDSHDGLFNEYKTFQRTLSSSNPYWPFESNVSELNSFNQFCKNFGSEYYWIQKYHLLVINQFFQPHVLDAVLSTGQSQAQLALGINFEQIFDNYKRFPHLLETYAEGFAHATVANNLEIAERLKFLEAVDLLDIGGGNGSQAMAIGSTNHQLASVSVLDLPESENALSDSRKRWIQHFNYSPDFIFGNFFNKDFVHSFASKKFGAISLSWILHDWNDEQCVEILRRAASLLIRNGRILIIEKIANDLNIANVQDFIMMVMAGGFERSLSEYQALFLEADLEIDRVVPSAKGRDLLILKQR